MRLPSKRWRLIIGLLVVMVIYAGVCAKVYFEVRSFRKHPQSEGAFGFFSGNLPHKILARMLVFKRGTEAYNHDIAKWAFHSRLISDSFWNRPSLEKCAENLSQESRDELLPDYPVTPTDRLVALVRKSLERDQFRVLPLLFRRNDEADKQIARLWIQDRVIKPHNVPLFVGAAGYLAKSDANSFTRVVNTFWPELSSSNKERVLAKVAADLPAEARPAGEVLSWLKSRLSDGKVKLSCGVVALLGRLLSISPSRDQTVELISQHWDLIAPEQVHLLLYFVNGEDVGNVSRLIIQNVRGRNSMAVLKIFKYVASQDGGITMAEELATPFLGEADSEFRKGLIVILVNNGSVRARGMIDESFKGKAPRRILYALADYSHGSEATESYRRLSGHDYCETGKTWPPSYGKGGPSSAEIAGWKSFISLYPWFPGTDDAYYRLAFSQYVQGDYQGCLATLREYFKREYWPDNDAKPYLIHMLRSLTLASDFSDPAMPYLGHIRNIAANPLASMIWGSHEKLESVLQSINWFLSNPRYQQFLNTDEQTLKMMHDVALAIRDSSSDSVCRLIAAKLQGARFPAPATTDEAQDSTDSARPSFNSGRDASSVVGEPDQESDSTADTSEEIEDERSVIYAVESCLDRDEADEAKPYPSTIVKSVLYGLFHTFRRPKQWVISKSLPKDPGEDALIEIARALKTQLSRASIQDAQNRSLDELITFALLHSDPDFAEWDNEFKPTMDFIIAVDYRDIPTIASEQYSELLKRRRR